MSSTATTSDPGPLRPRVEGEREQEILDATIDVLADLGYDRLTMDSVSTRARASKATLYRRWSSKAQLVIDALVSQKDHAQPADTGSLRGDLLATFCGHGALTDQRETAVFASVLTAISRDTEFAEAFRRDFIGPKFADTRALFDRAHQRGEIADDVDLDLLSLTLPGVVLHRMLLLGEPPDSDLVAQVVDQIILPAATRGLAPTPPTHSPHQAHPKKDLP